MDTPLSPAQAKLKLTLLDKKAEAKNSYELYAEFLDMGLPPLVLEILEKISKVVWKVAKEAFAIGKIILLEVIRFVKEHPMLVLSFGISYAIGSAIGGLVTAIPILPSLPWIGPLISQLLSSLSNLCQITFVVGGSLLGLQLDREFPNTGQDIQKAATDFFNMLARIIEAIQSRYAAEFNPA